MPDVNALMGHGMPAQLADLIGAQPHALTTAGVAQGTATTIKSKNTELVTAGGATGAILPSTAGINDAYFVTCPTATSGVVYVPSGHSLNGSLNAGLTIAQNKAAILYQYKRTLWASILTA